MLPPLLSSLADPGVAARRAARRGAGAGRDHLRALRLVALRDESGHDRGRHAELRGFVQLRCGVAVDAQGAAQDVPAVARGLEKASGTRGVACWWRVVGAVSMASDGSPSIPHTASPLLSPAGSALTWRGWRRTLMRGGTTRGIPARRRHRPRHQIRQMEATTRTKATE